MSGRFERFDARPAGSYRLVLTYADVSSARGEATTDSDIVEALCRRRPWCAGGAGGRLRFRRPDPRWHHDDDLGGHRSRGRDAHRHPRRRRPSGISAKITLPDSPLHSPTSPPTSSSNGGGHDRGAGLGMRRWPQRCRRRLPRDAAAAGKERYQEEGRVVQCHRLLRIGPNPSTNDAELIAFRVGEYRPRRVTLPDIGPHFHR